MEHRLGSIEDRLDAIEEHLHLKRKRHTMEDVPAPCICRPLPGMGDMTGAGDDEVRLMAQFLPHRDAAKLKDTSAILSAAVPAVSTYPLGLCLLQQYNDNPFANAVRDAAAIIIGAVGYELMRASLNPTEYWVYLERIGRPHLGAQVPLQSLKMMKGNLRRLFTGDPRDLIRTLMDEIPILPDVPSPDEYSRITASFWCKSEETKVQKEYKSINRLLKSNIVPQQNAKDRTEGLQFKFEVYTDLDGKSIVVSLQYIYNRKNRGKTLH